jgi:MYXO-CTERM domain-containing protein
MPIVHRHLLVVPVVVGLVAHAAAPARGEIIYRGESLPGTGTCPDGDISFAMDPKHGRVIRVRAVDKSGQPSERCEFVGGGGGRLMPGMTVWIGWRSRVVTPAPNVRNVMFQAKCHGMHVADQPLVFEMRGGKLTLNNHEDIGGVETPRTVWSRELPLDTWFTILMKVHYSESRTEGSVQLWFNGALQTLANGSTTHHGQTYDGAENNVHWGIYRGASVNGEAFHYLWRPRIATTRAEADPDDGTEPTADGSPDGAGVRDAGGAVPEPAAGDGAAPIADRGPTADLAVAIDARAAGGTGGAGGSGGSGGTGALDAAAAGGGGTGGDPGGGGASGAGGPPPDTAPAGCGCRLARPDHSPGAPVVLAMLLLLAVVRRRR